MSNYYISDLHLGNEKILSVRKQFNNLDDYKNCIITNWNETVDSKDSIYIVGDLFDYYKKEDCVDFLKRVRGNLVLIKGNHEEWLNYFNQYELFHFFSKIQDILTVKDNERQVTLCHYPMLEWNNHKNDDSYLIHGHIHTRKNRVSYEIIKHHLPRALNCCVDINNFKPVKLDELITNNNNWYNRREKNESITV